MKRFDWEKRGKIIKMFKIENDFINEDIVVKVYYFVGVVYI